jgi:hypothetical protein
VADTTFYSTVAQVIPVLFLAVAIDRGGFTRSLSREDIERLDSETDVAASESRVQKLLELAVEERAIHELSTATAEEKLALLGVVARRREELEKQRSERIGERHRESVLSSSYVGTGVMIFLAVAEAAATKTCLSGRPSWLGRVTCEFGILLGGGSLVFSLIDQEVRKIGALEHWAQSKIMRISTAGTGLAIALTVLTWRLV